jgi:hypothetical protein
MGASPILYDQIVAPDKAQVQDMDNRGENSHQMFWNIYIIMKTRMIMLNFRKEGILCISTSDP